MSCWRNASDAVADTAHTGKSLAEKILTNPLYIFEFYV